MSIGKSRTLVGGCGLLSNTELFSIAEAVGKDRVVSDQFAANQAQA